MSEMKHQASLLVIGDVVGSRLAADRRGLHDDLTRALAAVNDRWGTRLRITVGDEYQGPAPTLGAAQAAVLDLRLRLLPDHDVRHGLGRGPVATLDEAGGIEDGPGWWAAREAIEAVAELAARPAFRTARTAYRVAPGLDPASEAAGEAAVDAALLARDTLVGRLDDRSLSVLRGLLDGSTQHEVAEALGVSASAVSQRVRRDGLAVVTAMTDRMRELD